MSSSSSLSVTFRTGEHSLFATSGVMRMRVELRLSTVNRWRGGNFADVIVLMILVYETGTESDATHAASRSRSGRSVARTGL